MSYIRTSVALTDDEIAAMTEDEWMGFGRALRAALRHRGQREGLRSLFAYFGYRPKRTGRRRPRSHVNSGTDA